MNENHQRLCPSEGWASYIQDEVLPTLTADLKLGGALLEIGPGPGAATDWLRAHFERVVAIEVDEEAAGLLRQRFAGFNVEVVLGNGAALDFADETFDAVACFTMLHHVPTLSEQRSLLTEAVRVLRADGVLFGADSLASQGLHEFHEGDTYNPIDPSLLLLLLRATGCDEVAVKVRDNVTFVAHKPVDQSTACGNGAAPERTDVQ